MRKFETRNKAILFPGKEGYESKRGWNMDKSKLTPELITKILREHAELISLIQYAPIPGAETKEYEKWWERRTSLLEKIQK